MAVGTHNMLDLRYGWLTGILSICAGMTVAACAFARANASCMPPPTLSIVRIDERNERLFVQASPEIVSDLGNVKELLRKTKEYVETCHTIWSRNWSVSIFAEAKYAGYKDEGKIRGYVMDGSWEKAYLGEYDNHNGLLIRFPLGMSKRTEDKIMIE